MRRTLGLIALAVFALSVLNSAWSQDRAHDLASQAASQKPAKCPTPDDLTLKQCHDSFADGCSQAKKPGYDAYLDFLKDQDPDPSLAATKTLGQSDFSFLEKHLPKTLNSRNHSTLADTFAPIGEGNIHSVVAFLYFAEDTGAGTPPNSETCNCKLTTPGTFDYHLGIGFDPALAAIAKTHPLQTSAAMTKLEKASVVAEMTPFTRSSRHPKWTIDRVAALQGQQIKVVGQLMSDNEHFNKKDDCGFPKHKSSCWRSTVWEIHPVTQFLVCTASAGCSDSSPDSDWTSLDDMP
ncbi:MAG TPA: hypothetical protein VMH04_15875 [Candidatus Solibacter sp.]|nr:hypothetical protein [Candidatus Solibacter sp.]